MVANPATKWLAQALRQALRNLYDPPELRRSPLIEALGLDQADGSFALNRLLLDAVSALQPAPGISPQSDAWRTYQILYHRYVDQFSQTEVAANIGVSERQLRRLEKLALDTLAEYLRARYKISGHIADVANAHTGPAIYDNEDDEADPRPAPHTVSPVLLEQEARVLEQFSPSEPVSIHDMVQAAFETLSPLLVAQCMVADCENLDAHLHAAAHPASLRQALLIVLATLARSIQGGCVTVAARAVEDEICVDIGLQRPQGAMPESTDLSDLEIARQLVALSSGRLVLDPVLPDSNRCAIHLVLPSVRRKAVLVIDDNADALQLFSRYLVGTPYSFASLRDPLQAVELADRLQPMLILLDVMLPGMDGWEVLARLREHPRTRAIPVVACTVLPQEQLALSLGASGFLRKPVGREELLALLDGMTHRRSAN